MIHRKILEILVCPVTKTGLRFDSENQTLVSERAKKIFPIINGVPHLLIDKAAECKK